MLLSLLVFIAYCATGWLGLQIPAYGSNITPLWLPTGIAVAVFLRWGVQYWPAVALAAFALNMLVGSPWPVACAIAAGNTLGPWAAILAARRIGIQFAFQRPRDILALAGVAALGALLSATIGVTALASAGLLPHDRLGPWLLWWAGDTMGVVIGAPLVLASSRAQWQSIAKRSGEFLAWAILGGVIGWGIFVVNKGPAGQGWALAFLLLPSVAWAALRFGVVGTSLALVLVSFCGAYGTAMGTGPFYSENPLASTVLLWVYMATAAVLGWLVSAVHVARSASEYALQQSRRQLASIFHSIDDVVWSSTPDGHELLFISAAADRLYGRPAAQFMAEPMLWLDVVHPDDRAMTAAALERVSESGEFDAEYRIVRPDGTVRWVHDRARITLNADGGRQRLDGIATDITARKDAESAIRLQQAELVRFKSVLDQTVDCVFIFRTDNLRFVYANEGAKRQIGYTKDQLLGMTPMDIKPLVTAEAFRQLTQPLRDGTQRSVTAETVHRHKDGHLIPVELVLQLVQTLDGEERFVAISRDISDRKQAEQRNASEREVLELLASGAPLNDVLRRLALGFEATFPGMLCSVLVLDSDGRRLRRGAAPSLPESYCQAIEGQDVGPAAGACGTAAHTRRMTLCPDIASDPLWNDSRDLALAAGLRACWSVPVISSQDKVLGVFAVYYRSIRTPTTQEIASIERGARVMRLAIERHELLGALKESQVRLATLVENLPGMAYRCRNDADWTMTFVSDGCLAITGYRPDELQNNQAVAYGSLVHPDDRDWLWAKCQSSLEARAPCQNEYRIIDRQGRERWVSERASGAYDAEGKLRFIDGFILDISESRQARIEAERLAQTMREMQKLESIGTLAGGIAHEFNNLLTVMLGHTELALRDAGARSAASESLRIIRTAGEKARHMVRQILTFSRQQPGERHVTALLPVVEEAVGLLRTTLASTLQLDCQCSPDTPNVLADPMELQQVVVNLCINAAQAMTGRSGSVIVRTAAVTLPEHGRAGPDLAPGDYARIAVSDQGVGMDAATAGRIFEPFFTTKPVGEGTGLGLSVVHGIVHAHGGAITVQSEPGIGSTFEVYLPATQQRVVASKTSAPPVAPPGRKAHILFLDDQAWLLPLAQRMLEDDGYRVSAFADAREAIDRLRADPALFDVVVTDYKMPGMSGIEVGRAVHAVRADLPVVLMSGAVMDGLSAEAVDAGINAFIYKPAIVDELGPAVRKLLL
jgi:PAS domain S-box-containing protein